MKQDLIIETLLDEHVVWTAEQRLYEAVLERALRDAYPENMMAVGLDIQIRAIRWIMDESMSKNSFLYICDELDISDKFIERVRKPFYPRLKSSTAQPRNASVRQFSNAQRVSTLRHIQFAYDIDLTELLHQKRA